MIQQHELQQMNTLNTSDIKALWTLCVQTNVTWINKFIFSIAWFAGYVTCSFTMLSKSNCTDINKYMYLDKDNHNKPLHWEPFCRPTFLILFAAFAKAISYGLSLRNHPPRVQTTTAAAYVIVSFAAHPFLQSYFSYADLWGQTNQCFSFSLSREDI